MKKWYTADFHLGMEAVLSYENRPFKTIDEMYNHFINECSKKAKIYTEIQQDGTQLIVDKDAIIHIGDLATFTSNKIKLNPQKFIAQIPATFINIRGNHDINNKVKSIATSMRTTLGKYKNISVSHYPSYDNHAKNTFLPGDIHLCGHVHSLWKHCLDLKNKVLNINVGVDVWNYTIVSEDKLIAYIDKLFKLPINKLTKYN